MHSKAKGPTKAEQKRMERIVELGCVACWIVGRKRPIPAEIHHLLDGGTRRGHSATIGLCSWHHRGVCRPEGIGWSERNLGPSLVAHASSETSGGKQFRARFGTDDELLEFQNRLLEENP